MLSLHDSIPLISNGDAFLIELEYDLLGTDIHITGIQRYENNQNVAPTWEKFMDLDPETRRRVIAQINRRYKGKMIKI